MRHYTSARSVAGRGKPCRVCKDAVALGLGLGHRGGRGNFVTDLFHDRCAAEHHPRIVARLLADPARSSRCPPAQLAALQAALIDPLPPETARFDEHDWWDSGGLYDLAIADADAGSCRLSGESIEPGTLVIRRPHVAYGGARQMWSFALASALHTTDFDWERFAERFDLALRASPDPDALRAALSRVPAEPDAARRLAALLTAAAPSAERPPIFGLDRKGGAKRDMVWHLFFARALSQAERDDLAATLRDVSCTWERERICEIRYADPRSKLKVADFIAQLDARLDELHARVGLHAAHLCRAGELRDSRARVLTDLGEPAYPFAFFNRGAELPTHDWLVRVRFAAPLADDARTRVTGQLADEEYFVSWDEAGGWLGLSRSTPWHRWALQAVTEQLERLHAEHPIALAIVGEPGADSSDPWHRWSATGRDLAALATELAGVHLVAVEATRAQVRALVAEARRTYEADDATDDLGMLVDGFRAILGRLAGHPKAQAEVRAMLDELLASL